MTDEQTSVPVDGAPPSAGEEHAPAAGGDRAPAAGGDRAPAAGADRAPTSPRGGQTPGPHDARTGPAHVSSAVEDDAAIDDATPLDLDALRTRAAERDEYLALAQRTRADLDNYRKRVTRDAAAAEARATGRVVRELLPAIDNLSRALAAATAHASTTDESTTLAAGMRLVQSELLSALTRVGVESYAPLGEPFDPTFHEAIAQHYVPGAEPGTVVEVYQSGYRLDSSVIRPARVVVAGEVPAGEPQGS
jgi:molecular chaperone GrpE